MEDFHDFVFVANILHVKAVRYSYAELYNECGTEQRATLSASASVVCKQQYLVQHCGIVPRLCVAEKTFDLSDQLMQPAVPVNEGSRLYVGGHLPPAELGNSLLLLADDVVDEFDDCLIFVWYKI